MAVAEGRPKRGRRPKVPELFGLNEVAECLDVQRPNLRDIKDLPEPVAGEGKDWKIAASPLWLADEIRAFAPIYNARRRRKPEDADDQLARIDAEIEAMTEELERSKRRQAA